MIQVGKNKNKSEISKINYLNGYSNFECFKKQLIELIFMKIKPHISIY